MRTGSQPLISWSIKENSTLSSPDDAMLPEVYTPSALTYYERPLGYKGYKDGLQPESLADGNWLVKQINKCQKLKLNLTQT